MRLRNCAYAALVITSSAANAQDVQLPLDSTDAMTGLETALQASAPGSDADGVILLGQDKVSPLCPEFCAPRRVTSPEYATVGEREVLAYTMALAANGPKLRVDSRRAVWAQMDKIPSAASSSQVPTMVTRNEFRPALDPVLAEPTTEPLE